MRHENDQSVAGDLGTLFFQFPVLGNTGVFKDEGDMVTRILASKLLFSSYFLVLFPPETWTHK